MANLVLGEGSPQSVGMDPRRLLDLKQTAARWVTDGETPSMVLLVARHGKIVFHEAFGVRHYEDATPTLRTDSIFPIASCTKPMTAALVMSLVEDGLIGPNRSVVEYVPELASNVEWLEEVKVADLLCHTACMDELQWVGHVNAAAAKSPDLPPPAPGQHPVINRRIRLAAGAPLARRPGSAMLYSNFGYLLLGDIVRRVSGQPLWQFAQSRLFGPLGMRNTFYRLPSEMRARRVYRKPGYPSTMPVPGLHGGLDSVEFDELDIGSNGVASTAHDMAVFLQTLMNGGCYGQSRVLSRASVAAMSRQQLDPSIPALATFLDAAGKPVEFEFKGGGYGFGLYLYLGFERFATNGSLASHRAFGHTGYHGLYMFADPEYELIGVCLSVSPRIKQGFPATNCDLFMNAVYGAIAD